MIVRATGSSSTTRVRIAVVTSAVTAWSAGRAAERNGIVTVTARRRRPVGEHEGVIGADRCRNRAWCCWGRRRH
jgi:hypothetical protein